MVKMKVNSFGITDNLLVCAGWKTDVFYTVSVLHKAIPVIMINMRKGVICIQL